MKILRWGVKAAPKRRRYQALSGHDKFSMKRFHNLFLLSFTNYLKTRNSPRRRMIYLRSAAYFFVQRERLRLVELLPLTPSEKKQFLVESFNLSDSYRYLRFKRSMIRKLFTGLRVYDLPEWVLIDKESGNIYHREMMFLLLLYRYAQGGTYYALQEKGWGDEGTVCRAFNTASELLYQTWKGMIQNDLPRAVSRFPEYNRAFKNRLRAVTPPNTPLAHDASNLAVILDGTRRNVGEPIDADVEESLYSGYTGTHCLGFLAMVGASMLCHWLKGPFAGRDPDQVYVPISNLENDMEDAQRNEPIHYWGYGDRLFNDSRYLKAAPRGNRWYVVPDWLIQEHKPLRRVRYIVEVFFGKIAVLFKYANYDAVNRVLICPVGRHFFNIVLLTNCHTILVEHNVADKFHVSVPSLQNYLQFAWND